MEIIKKITITEQNIEDIIDTAFEGGINYWCDNVDIITNPENKEMASEIIAYNGKLKLMSENKEYTLTRDMILQGIDKTMTYFNYGSFDSLMNELDAIAADVIIQFALWNKIIFG